MMSQSHAYLVDTSRSPQTRLRPVPLSDVTLDDIFWEPRRKINRQETLFSQYQHLEETGCIDNFRRASGKKPDVPFRGMYFSDSDLYKWLEAASWSLATHPDKKLADLVDQGIAEIADAQQPDGYVNTYFAQDKADQRWTNFDLHEMYCAGHLFQAAVAHHRATGQHSYLDIATRFADHLCDTFGPEAQGKRVAVDGHEEVELALVELYRTTAQKRYLEQAKFFIQTRGHGFLGNPYGHFSPEYSQDHKSFAEMDEMVGHAVRAVYYTSGAANLYAETGNPALRKALETLWRNMITRRMYVTGGIGSRYQGEAFGEDYELPHSRAYAESCAAIGSVMWNWRMLALEGEAHYADVMETALYNGVMPGLSLDGQHYFYQNPLADNGKHRRQAWFGCACCPPNIARLLASLPGYCYSTSDEGVWLHLYAEGSLHTALTDGQTVHLRQQTRYPWDGDIRIEIQDAGTFELFLRVPAWCEQGATLSINGEPTGQPLTAGSYARIGRNWQPGDTVRLQLPMPVRLVASHPYVSDNQGQVAVLRGPLVYCLEQCDHADFDIRDVTLSQDTEYTAQFRPELLGGVSVIQANARIEPLDTRWQGQLYQNATNVPAPQATSKPITAVPYALWANREAGGMRVWQRQKP